MTDVEQALLQVREVFVNSYKKYKTLVDQLRVLDEERQDVLHAIEFGKADAIHRQDLYKELKDVSERRRKVKNEIEVLEAVKELASKSKPTENVINQYIGKVRKIIANQENRTYGMRVRKDLQHFIKGKGESK